MDQAAAPTSVLHVRPSILFRVGFGAGAILVLAALIVFWVGGSRILLGVLPSYASLTAGALGVVVAMGCSFASARRTRLAAAAAVHDAGERVYALEQRARELDEQVRQLTRFNNELEERGDELEHIGRELAAVHRESGIAVAAVKPYFSFIDEHFVIDARYSGALERVLRLEPLGGKDFLDVLDGLVPPSVFESARDYLTLLFDPSRDEAALADVNPLVDVAIGVRNERGSAVRRYVTFRFGRVVEDGAVTRGIVGVSDVTERIARDERLHRTERQKASQFDVLLGMLHVPEPELDRFVALVKENLSYVDDALNGLDIASAAPSSDAVRASFAPMLERIRAISTNAVLLRLERFDVRAKALERRIAQTSDRGIVGAGDVVALGAAIADFWSEYEEFMALRARRLEAERDARGDDGETDDLIASVGELATTLAKHFGEPVRIDARDFDSRPLPPDRRLVVKDVLVQLVRNSLAHGIEPAAERDAAGKPRVATIAIHPIANDEPDSFAFTYRDDGRGLDPAAIRRRAVASGMLDEAAAASVDDSDVASFIFEPGFTTIESLSREAGRGMGMNVVKDRVVDDCGGEIELDSEPGAFCEFSFVLPLRPQHALAS
ncbi:MAG: hypothetical protein IAI48_10245 [Candidatus Eremiobacteraeota bacterium]|nr:hypothetical protein [Candidatus Eremiobacteraeota bacterium]